MKIFLTQDSRTVLTNAFNLLAMTLILSGLLVKTQAKKMDDAVCKPRPVAVPVTEGHKVLPYHVLMHRCSGTCENTSPHVKSCEVNSAVEIDLEVTDVFNRKKIIQLANHTSCLCACKCRPNEIPMNQESCNCKCIKNCDPQVGGPNSSGTRKGNEKKIPMPYFIGMIVVGTFAMIVILFDATLYVNKKSGFFHCIKDSCCGSTCRSGSSSKNKNPEKTKSAATNGQAIMEIITNV